MQVHSTFGRQALAQLAAKGERVARRRRAAWSAFAALTLVAGSGLATVAGTATQAGASTSTGTGISYTLSGCDASVAAYLPGTFVCPGSYASTKGSYTTGNLGKGWNELDLVPGRVEVQAGNSPPSIQNYSFVVAVDNCSGTGSASSCSGVPGYDQLSALTLNTTYSSASGCGSIVSNTPAYVVNSGGTTSLYRQIDVTGHQANADCFYDFYARLALGSHAYPGSSLHYNLLNTSLTSANIGNKEVSIPVSAILPPTIHKGQTATQGSSIVWLVSKGVDHRAISFPNTCDATASTTASVQITVSWTKTPTVSGAITVDGHITVVNNAHREIDVTVSDQLYNGTSATAGNENTNSTPPSPIVTGGGLLNMAGSSTYSFDDVWSVPSGTASSFSDIATATYSDPVFHQTLGSIPSNAATSNVVSLAAGSGNSATLQDVETLTEGTETVPNDYSFKVNSTVPSSYGSFENGYTVGAVAPSAGYSSATVTWDSPTLVASGSIVFNKTINVLGPTEDTASLADTATLSPAGQDTKADSVSSAVSSGALVSIAVSKSTSETFNAEKDFVFDAYAPGQYPDGTVAGSTTVVIPAGYNHPDGANTPHDPSSISGLDPGVPYTLYEPAAAPFGPQTITGVEVDLPSCSVSQAVVNTATLPIAQVQKITLPTGSTHWKFTLSGMEAGGVTPVSDLAGGASEVLSDSNNDAVVANTGYAQFASNLDQDGATYTITETAQTNWDLTGVAGGNTGSPNDTSAVGPASRYTTSTATATCSFQLNLTTDSGKNFDCSFTNTERSDVTVVKTQNGGVPTNGYQFCLTGGPDSINPCLTTDSTNHGTLDFGYQKPGGYTLCEQNVPVGTHSTLQDPPYSGILDGLGNVCDSFTLSAGSNQTFTIDNTFPGGNALTIGYWKHWNTYTLGSNAWAISAKTGNALMDSFLPQWLGGYEVQTAHQGMNVLSAPSCQYAENCVAAQLLAAELNVAAGAGTCGASTAAISEANTLLSGIGYGGPVGKTVGSKNAQRSLFISTESALDSYNNNNLCP